MSKVETVEAEIVEDEFKAPVLQDAKELSTLVNVDELVEKYKEIPDIDPESEKAGEQYQYVLKGHKELVKARTGIQKLRKQIGDPAFQFHKKCIAIEKEVLSKLSPVENRLQAARTLVEDHEKRKQEEAERIEIERVESIEAAISAIRNLPLKCITANSTAIKQEIEGLIVPTAEVFQEFEEQALAAYTTTMQQLESNYDTKVKAENADKIEAERRAQLEAEEAERKAKEQEEREAFEAEKREFERQKAEQDANLRAQQEEIDRKNAEREAEELQKRQEAERQEKAAQDKELHNTRISESMNEIQKIVSTSCANTSEDIYDLVVAIIDGEIPHVKWVPDGK